MTKKFKSFAFTISTTEQITKESDIHKYIEDWIKSKDYGVAIIEKSSRGKLHAHGQLFCNTETTKDSVKKRLLQNILRLAPLSNKHAVDIAIAYNDDFINNYMEKDDFQWEIYRNLPEVSKDFYPSEEEQLAVMEKHNAKDAFFHMLKELWGDKYLTAETHIQAYEEVAIWFYDQMYLDKTISVIIDDRKRKQTINCLIHYLFPHQHEIKSHILTKEQETQLNYINLLKD